MSYQWKSCSLVATIIATSFPRKKMPIHSKFIPSPSGSPVKCHRTNLYFWIDKTSLKHLSKLEPRLADPNPLTHTTRMLYVQPKECTSYTEVYLKKKIVKFEWNLGSKFISLFLNLCFVFLLLAVSVIPLSNAIYS